MRDVTIDPNATYQVVIRRLDTEHELDAAYTAIRDPDAATVASAVSTGRGLVHSLSDFAESVVRKSGLREPTGHKPCRQGCACSGGLGYCDRDEVPDGQ